MKKRILACLLCVQMVLFTLFQVTSVVMAEDGDAMAVSDEGENPVAANSLEWMSYRDYLIAETTMAWNNPEIYVGQTAYFDVDTWLNFEVSSGFDDSEGSSIFLDNTDLCDDNGQGLQVVISDYYFDENTSCLWYKVEALEGETLPEYLVNNPYVLQILHEEDEPALIMLPKKAMFSNTTVWLQTEMEAASHFIEVNVADLPSFFEYSYANEDEFGNEWYDLGDVTKWGIEGITSEYHYVLANNVILIPAIVSRAYEDLSQTESTDDYNFLMSVIPEEVTSQFTDKHLAGLEAHLDYLYIIENVEHTTNVTIGGVPVPITVKGKIPKEGVTLVAAEVPTNDIMNGGFDIEDATEIAAALDIKIINNNDGTEWQPEEGDLIWVSIGMSVLGYEEGRIFELQHKHDDTINRYEICIVMDGYLTVATSGFSTFLVNSTTATNGTQIGTVAELTVGKETIFYVKNLRDGNTNYTPNLGNWFVTDLEGAIYYEVYAANGDDAIGNTGMYIPYIKIIPLKETTENIKLEFRYSRRNNNNATLIESHELRIVAPRPTGTDTKKLFIKDEVNTTGCITATLVDVNGNVISDGLDGAAFTWERMDGDLEMFIMPYAYENQNRSINIAKDHGGLLESKRDSDGNYIHTKYEVTATLSDGSVLNDEYIVYYQSEIINASFEAPPATAHTYTFFPNGWAGMYWKTTGPGTEGNLTKDIEYVDFEPDRNGNPSNDTNPAFGVASAADGFQFAELNAEAFGTLYQDIITVPDEEVTWDFAHAARRDRHNEMYIVLGPTEFAQKLTTQKQLEDLAKAAREADIGNKLGSGGSVKVSYGGAEYEVWYHNSPDDGVWRNIGGTYTAKQYRTRVFFMSQSQSKDQNYGNLIDTSRVGQYKSYLIEYYTETFVNGEKITKYLGAEPAGEALLYSSVPLTKYEDYLAKNYYLHKILINGSNYPYNIRYSGDESLFVDKYPGTAKDPFTNESSDKYKDIGIVMQVFFRDTIIAVQKELVFPEALTVEQKLKIIEDLNKSPEKSYKADFHLYTNDGGTTYSVEGSVPITHQDPTGKYTGYLSLGENPPLGNEYYVQETDTTDIVGLELDTVTFSTTLYKYGEENKPEKVQYDEIVVDGEAVELKSSLIPLVETKKIAEVVVANKYKEKLTTVYYEAVGNGKVALTGQTNFEDTPTETLPFYSGKSIGAEIHVGTGASFDGWYKDKACTIPVTAADGVYDSSDGSFKPNANIISTEAITFYAKFVTGTIKIERTNAEPYQIFVYHVTGDNLDIYVTLTCDKEGNGITEIYEVPLSTLSDNITYTVTEEQNWSWRHGDFSVSKENTINSTTKIATFLFDGGSNKTSWLNGMTGKQNIFKGGQS